MVPPILADRDGLVGKIFRLKGRRLPGWPKALLLGTNFGLEFASFLRSMTLVKALSWIYVGWKILKK